VEAGTAAAIKRDAPLAARLSGERIGAEIEGILAAAHPARALQLAADLGIFAAIAPALATEWNAEVGTRVEAVGGETLPDAPDPLGRMSELLLPIADDDDVAALLESWRRPRATIAAIQQIRALDRAVAVALYHHVTDGNRCLHPDGANAPVFPGAEPTNRSGSQQLDIRPRPYSHLIVDTFAADMPTVLAGSRIAKAEYAKRKIPSHE
jgi:hypothetical protein